MIWLPMQLEGDSPSSCVDVLFFFATVAFFQVMVYMGGLGPGALEFYGCAQVISPL